MVMLLWNFRSTEMFRFHKDVQPQNLDVSFQFCCRVYLSKPQNAESAEKPTSDTLEKI